MALNETHDPQLRSWVAAANVPGSDFPMQNLPLGRIPPRRQQRAVSRRSRDRRSDSRSRRRCERGAFDRPPRGDRPPAAGRPRSRPECAHGGRPAAPGRHCAWRCRARCAAGSPQQRIAAIVPAAAGAGAIRVAGAHRRLHRLLYLDPSCDRGRAAVPARQAADAQLQLAADRLPRPQLLDWQSPGSSSSGRSGQSSPPGADARRSLRPSQRLDYELELGVFIGRGNALGTPHRHRRGRVARVRPVPAQRLVGARPAGLGVPAARAVSRQELRHHDFAVDRHARSAGALPRALDAPGRRPAAAGVSGFAAAAPRRRDRHPARSACCETAAMRARRAGRPAAVAQQFPARLLEHRADGRAPHRQRLQPAAAAICSVPARNRGRSRPRPARCWSSRRRQAAD